MRSYQAGKCLGPNAMDGQAMLRLWDDQCLSKCLLVVGGFTGRKGLVARKAD